MVEVTRMRRGGIMPPSATPAARAAGASEWVSSMADMVTSKLGQLAPQIENLLVVGLEAQPPGPDDLRSAMLRIQQRAEAGDSAVVERAAFRDRPGFFQHYYRLSGILLRRVGLEPGEPVVLWDNLQARHPLPSRVRTALMRSHAL